MQRLNELQMNLDRELLKSGALETELKRERSQLEISQPHSFALDVNNGSSHGADHYGDALDSSTQIPVVLPVGVNVGISLAQSDDHERILKLEKDLEEKDDVLKQERKELSTQAEVVSKLEQEVSRLKDEVLRLEAEVLKLKGEKEMLMVLIFDDQEVDAVKKVAKGTPVKGTTKRKVKSKGVANENGNEEEVDEKGSKEEAKEEILPKVLKYSITKAWQTLSDDSGLVAILFKRPVLTTQSTSHVEADQSKRTVSVSTMKEKRGETCLYEPMPYTIPYGCESPVVCACNAFTMNCTVQPFSIIVHPHVQFLCELHGNLSKHEVLGFLAGTWDNQNQTVYVQWVLPLDGIFLIDGLQNCEADDNALITASTAICAMGLSLVGWYHSHPTFQPYPSLKDLTNHISHVENLLREQPYETRGPYIGLIVGIESTEHLWFHASKDSTSGVLEAKRLNARTLNISNDVRFKDSATHSLDWNLLFNRDDNTNNKITLPNANLLLLPDTYQYLLSCIIHLIVYYMSFEERVQFTNAQGHPNRRKTIKLHENLLPWLQYLLAKSDSMKFAESLNELVVHCWGSKPGDH